MWTPFCDGSRSTAQSIVARISFSRAPRPIRTAFWTPVTPARESPIWISGDGGLEVVQDGWVPCATAILCHARAERHVLCPPRLARLPRRPDAAGDRARLRADALTDGRTGAAGRPYVEMIEAASAQIAELLDELSLAARLEGGRYEPALREADTLELALAAADGSATERVHVTGEGTACRPTSPPSTAASPRSSRRAPPRRPRRGRSRPPRRDRRSPITDSSAPVVLGRDLRDLGAAVAVRLVETLGGTVAVEAGVLTIRPASRRPRPCAVRGRPRWRTGRRARPRRRRRRRPRSACPRRSRAPPRSRASSG